MSLFGTCRSIFDEVLVRKVFLGFTDNFHFVKFLFSDFLFFFAVVAILSLFGPNSAIFWLWVASKNFFVGFHISTDKFISDFIILDVVCGSY